MRTEWQLKARTTRNRCPLPLVVSANSGRQNRWRSALRQAEEEAAAVASGRPAGGCDSKRMAHLTLIAGHTSWANVRTSLQSLHELTSKSSPRSRSRALTLHNDMDIPIRCEISHNTETNSQKLFYCWLFHLVGCYCIFVTDVLLLISVF